MTNSVFWSHIWQYQAIPVVNERKKNIDPKLAETGTSLTDYLE